MVLDIKREHPTCHPRWLSNWKCYYGHHLYSGRYLVFFPKMAFYFKLNYFKLIYMYVQANVSLHLFSLILQSTILICLQTCDSGLENARYDIVSRWLSYFESQQCCYTKFDCLSNPADFFCSSIQFYVLLSPYLSYLYLDIYFLGDDALIS